MTIQDRLKTIEQKLEVLNTEGESWLRSPLSNQVYKGKTYYRVKNNNSYQWLGWEQAGKLIKEEKQRMGIVTPVVCLPVKHDEWGKRARKELIQQL